MLQRSEAAICSAISRCRSIILRSFPVNRTSGLWVSIACDGRTSLVDQDHVWLESVAFFFEEDRRLLHRVGRDSGVDHSGTVHRARQSPSPTGEHDEEGEQREC